LAERRRYGVGTSKRYAAHFDQLGMEREIARLAGLGRLQTLSNRELRLDSLPVTIDPKPRRVRAWVRFGEQAVRVEAFAERWTRDAVGIRFTAQGVEHRCWVWNSAVEPVENPR
jgi:hypothetical protein